MYEVLTMNCIECKKKIKDFLNDSLNTRQTVDFVNHVNECPECMEELSVDFLVNEGLKRLESGTGFNLNDDFKNMLSQSKKKYSNIKSLRHMVYTVASMAAIITFMMLIVGVFR